ncbi:hypothetical protein SAMN05216390_102105 [Lachnospiraceae bacterium KH1T2]|nr:hypothetical protein SAMN05216390_102105 [Lachnospiraceae bacterium KH1T2]
MKKKMDKLVPKISGCIEDITAVILSCFMALLFGLNSPLHPWIGHQKKCCMIIMNLNFPAMLKI